MALKQLTSDEKRKMILKSAEDQLKTKSFHPDYGDAFDYTDIMNKLYSKGTLISKVLRENVDHQYGSTEDYEDIEYKIAQILFLIYLIKQHQVCIGNFVISSIKEETEELISNILRKLAENFPEYEIYNPEEPEDGDYLTYEATETKTVTDNLKDIPEILASPIKQLLSNMPNENELIGLISKIYKDIEKIPPEKTCNLNKVDKSILEKTQKLAKMIVNSVEAAKGHNGESKLKIKDIAHNFALLASLIHKLFEINDSNKQ